MILTINWNDHFKKGFCQQVKNVNRKGLEIAAESKVNPCRQFSEEYIVEGCRMLYCNSSNNFTIQVKLYRRQEHYIFSTYLPSVLLLAIGWVDFTTDLYSFWKHWDLVFIYFTRCRKGRTGRHWVMSNQLACNWLLSMVAAVHLASRTRRVRCSSVWGGEPIFNKSTALLHNSINSHYILSDL